MPPSITPIQSVSLVLFLIADVLLVLLALVMPRRRGYILPFFLYSLHNSIFYTAVLYVGLTGVSIFPILIVGTVVTRPFELWSQVIRAQAAFTLVGVTSVGLIERFVFNRQGRRP